MLSPSLNKDFTYLLTYLLTYRTQLGPRSYIYRTMGFMEFDRLFLLMSKDFRAPFASYRKGALSRIQRHVLLMILSGSLVQ